MNKSFYTLALLAISIGAAFAGNTEKFVKSKPEKVTVYMSGAQVFRTADLNLPAGQTQIVIEGLEANIDQQSVQAGGKGNFIITGVQYNVHYPELQTYKATGFDAKYNKLIKQINDSLQSYDFDLKELYVKKEVLQTEKSVLLGNRLYKGESKKDSLELLKSGLAFLREKLMNINLELLKMEKQEMTINQKKNELNSRLTQIQADLGAQHYPVQTDKTDYRIVIDVIAEAATPAVINVNYYVASAGWTPVYDLRTEGVESPVKLTYKALVHQNTGADWKDVKLTLSTGNPHQSFNIPTLNAWYLGQYVRHNTYNKKKLADNRPSDAEYAAVDDTKLSVSGTGPASTAMQDAEWNTNYTTMTDNYVQAEFEIKLPYTIPSDNKTHIVAVMNKELPTKYVYKSVPKLDMNAYLTARVTGWEDMNLLPGQATLFFAGTYVGQTYLNSVETNDTLSLTLGQDKSIVIKREKQKDKIKEKMLDNDKLYTFAYEIVVKNGNAKNIEIEIQDQLPLSTNKQVVIQKENISGADYNENTGILTWKNSIKAKDNKKINFSYTIKAPKEMPVAVR